MAVKRLFQPLLIEVVANEAHRTTQDEHAVKAAVGDQLIRLRDKCITKKCIAGTVTNEYVHVRCFSTDVL